MNINCGHVIATVLPAPPITMKVMLKFETMYYYLLLKLYAAVVIDIQDEAGQSNIFVASFIFYN